MNSLRTSDLAKAVGAHPKTVRRYVDRGILPPVERSAAGHRRFTDRHLDCLRLARQVYSHQYPRKAIFQLGARASSGSPSVETCLGALELAYRHLDLVRSERTQADAAADLLERWALGAPIDAPSRRSRLGRAPAFWMSRSTSCAAGIVTA